LQAYRPADFSNNTAPFFTSPKKECKILSVTNTQGIKGGDIYDAEENQDHMHAGAVDRSGRDCGRAHREWDELRAL